MSSMPPSTNEVAALGSRVASGIVILTANAGNEVWNTATVDPFAGTRPTSVVATIIGARPVGTIGQFNLIPHAIARVRGSTGIPLITTPVQITARTTDGSFSDSWGDIAVTWVAVA